MIYIIEVFYVIYRLIYRFIYLISNKQSNWETLSVRICFQMIY